MNSELEIAWNNAESANQAKSEFLTKNQSRTSNAAAKIVRKACRSSDGMHHEESNSLYCGGIGVMVTENAIRLTDEKVLLVKDFSYESIGQS